MTGNNDDHRFHKLSFLQRILRDTGAWNLSFDCDLSSSPDFTVIILHAQFFGRRVDESVQVNPHHLYHYVQVYRYQKSRTPESSKKKTWITYISLVCFFTYFQFVYKICFLSSPPSHL